jgi:dienelactone hydrolase
MTDVTIDFDGETLASPWFRAAPDAPAVLIFPTVMGVSEFEIGYADRLGALGYGAMIGDLFGASTRGQPREQMFGHLQRLKGDRAALRRRVVALHDAMLDEAGVAAPRSAAIGFCFGGMCVLDLARSGADIASVGSFHGLFDPPGLPPQPIKARVAAYHGWDDPLAAPDTVVALAKELTEAACQWQIDSYGHTGHGFTNPAAAGSGMGYNETAATHSWSGFSQILSESFA